MSDDYDWQQVVKERAEEFRKAALESVARIELSLSCLSRNKKGNRGA